jgi:hypothetical protein
MDELGGVFEDTLDRTVNSFLKLLGGRKIQVTIVPA